MNRSLAERTKAFALRIIRVFSALPRTEVGRVIGRQMLRSGTSVGAHGREAFRSRSDAELISKIEVAIQELDETMYWMELLVEAEIVSPRRLQPLHDEADELMAILVSSVKTIKARRRR
jgi:four helix bundle protein